MIDEHTKYFGRNFKKNTPNDFGKKYYTNENNPVQFEFGYYNSGQRNGKFIVVYKDGTVQEGYIYSNEWKGLVATYFPNGMYEYGWYNNNQKHGISIYKAKNEKYFTKCFYENGL